MCSGVVKDNTGAPVANASVLVKGTNEGTSTDAAGRFTIAVNGRKAVIEITSVGYKIKDVSPGDKNQLEIILESSAGTMQEVVVTALGIKRSPRSLGYTVQQVGGAEVARSNTAKRGPSAVR